jgi:hypothetical protein
MLNQPTLEKLQIMKLHGMADAFRAQLETTDTSQLSFEERFAMLVDQQWLWKENRTLARRLRAAKLKECGVIEDIDYQHPRGLGRKLVRTLASSDWVRQRQKLLLIGPTDPVNILHPLATSLKTFFRDSLIFQLVRSNNLNRSNSYLCFLIKPGSRSVVSSLTCCRIRFSRFFNAIAVRTTSGEATSLAAICQGAPGIIWVAGSALR